ncbi:MAG: hypothetical protein IT361_15615 [Gemmatimonadaceae bacterium]|nr:hypothetical protein [Gemmatimonadaceae bacterium]
MTSDELDRLAALIAAEIERVTSSPSPASGPWLPIPVRPAPPRGPREAPVWSAAALTLDDVAPGQSARPSTHRDDPGSAAASIRAAAAGKGPVRVPQGSRAHITTSRQRGGSIKVPIGVSNRHVHLSAGDAERLFGSLTVHRPLSQPGEFAADQRVNVIGPTGRIDGVRVVGPARAATQVELSPGDAARIGVAAPVANSGRLDASVGGVTLEGALTTIALHGGVIVPARHLHLSLDDGRRWHLADGDVISVRCGSGARAAVLEGVLVRCGSSHATELHLDVDEARAVGVRQGDSAVVLNRATGARPRRPLVTERDVLALASRGEAIPRGALLTPGARDRARALGLACD